MGYALIGRGAAYVGVPPIYIGEIALLTGMLIVISSGMGCLVATFVTLPGLLLFTLMVWVLLRTLPYVGDYGIDALRDSVVLMYGGFAFIVIVILLDDCRRVLTLLRYYGKFQSIFIPLIPFVVLLNYPTEDATALKAYIPRIPGYDIPIIMVRGGEVAAHLAGACVFALVGFRKITGRWIILVALTFVELSIGRSATITFALPTIFAMLMLGKLRALVRILLAGIVIFFAAYTAETFFMDDRDRFIERSLSTRQIADNVVSIVSTSSSSSDSTRLALEATKQWRIEWWSVILGDTIYGPHFWTGRGFGLNLADADGFQQRRNPNSPPLRSPHSVHMTILARAGVPGLALWILFLVSWGWMVMNAMLTARRGGQTEWAGLFLFIFCYVMSIIVDASFDVAIEGPMIGIWFWSLIGFGLGAAMVYRAVPMPSREEFYAGAGH